MVKGEVKQLKTKLESLKELVSKKPVQKAKVCHICLHHWHTHTHNVYMHPHVPMYVCPHMPTHAHTYTCANAHVHIYTFIQTLAHCPCMPRHMPYFQGQHCITLPHLSSPLISLLWPCRAPHTLALLLVTPKGRVYRCAK